MLQCMPFYDRHIFVSHRRWFNTINNLFWNWKSERFMNTSHSLLLLNQHTIRLRGANPRDTPNIMKLLRNTFSANEPLATALQMTPGHYNPVLEEHWRSSLEQGMTFMLTPIKDIGANILGVAINTKICPWDPDLMQKLSTCVKCLKTRDFLNLWSYFIDESEIFKRFNYSKIFHINNIILDEKTSKKYRSNVTGHMLASLLLDKSIRFALKNGTSAACLISTGEFLSRVATTVGMELHWTCPYKCLLNEKLQPLLQDKYRNNLIEVFVKDLRKNKNLK